MSTGEAAGRSARDRSPSPRVDVCVVGSGPAGALVAHRLADRGHDVVVLEAGPRFDPGDRDERMARALRPGRGAGAVWGGDETRDAYTTAGERFYPLNASRVKAVGGTSLHWQGMVMRLHEDDFATRSRHGVGRDWPISYEDVRPYYAEAERALGVAASDDDPFAPPRQEPTPMPGFPPSHSDEIFREACDRLGIVMHGMPNARNSESYDDDGPCVGYGTCRPVCASGAKYDATRHVAAAERAGARVIDRVPVRRLEHDRAGERLEAAVYTTPDGEERRQEARQFVVACGGVETPRLLLLSRSTTYPDGLANGSGCVGRYFMEHLFGGTGGRIDRRTRQHHVGFMTSACHQLYDDPTRGTDGPAGGVPSLDVVREDVTPMRLEFLNNAGPSPVGAALASDAWGDALLDDLRSVYGNSLAMGALVGQRPRKENRVTLDPSTTDDNGDPVPAIHWRIDRFTRRTLRRANAIQERVLDELDAKLTWQMGPRDPGPTFHHMGTTRMGTDPDESVVTPFCRTHDLANCWIAGSSVFVTSGAMNPTLTIAALALRTADELDATL